MLIYDIKHGAYDYTRNDPAVWDKLNRAKSKLDEPFMRNPATARTIINMLDPFGTNKRELSSVTTYAVSRAWMKCYEIDTTFGLIKPDTYVWDNCSFPGMFIAAHNHIHATLYNTPIKWVASSLYGAVASLPDTYGLYSNYRSKWLMHDGNDGNVCFSNNLRDFQKQLGRTITLYTSDLGMDASNSYNDQEGQHLAAHYGQSIAGILTLVVGGDFVVKHFTFAHAKTQALIRILASLFTEFYICKPATSSIANSEVYFVGKGFVGISPADCEALMAEMPTEEVRGGAGSGEESAATISQNIMYAATDIYTRQAHALMSYTAIVAEYADLDMSNPRNKKMIRQAVDRTYYHVTRTDQQSAIKNWMAKHHIKKINSQCDVVKPVRVSINPEYSSRRGPLLSARP